MAAMTYFGHLNELRKHLWFSVGMLLVGFTVSLIFFNDIIAVLTAPLVAAADQTGGELYLTTIYESLLARIKVSLVSGLVFTLPLHISNLLFFIFPALTSREKRIASVVVFAGFALVVFSVYYGYLYLIPYSIRFLTGGDIVAEGTSFLLGFTKNVFYIVQIFVALIVIFQLPLLMILLISLKVITVRAAFQGGRYVVVGAFILSAVLTPPDIVSQVMTALPLIFLYYMGLLVARVFRVGER